MDAVAPRAANLPRLGTRLGISPSVNFNPSDFVHRRSASWTGIRVEAVDVTRYSPIEYGVTAPSHLLIAVERAEREDGETTIDGLTSSMQDFSGRLSFVAILGQSSSSQ